MLSTRDDLRNYPAQIPYFKYMFLGAEKKQEGERLAIIQGGEGIGTQS